MLRTWGSVSMKLMRWVINYLSFWAKHFLSCFILFHLENNRKPYSRMATESWIIRSFLRCFSIIDVDMNDLSKYKYLVNNPAGCGVLVKNILMRIWWGLTVDIKLNNYHPRVSLSLAFCEDKILILMRGRITLVLIWWPVLFVY